jgi:hypothetical protein
MLQPKTLGPAVFDPSVISTLLRSGHALAQLGYGTASQLSANANTLLQVIARRWVTVDGWTQEQAMHSALMSVWPSDTSRVRSVRVEQDGVYWLTMTGTVRAVYAPPSIPQHLAPLLMRPLPQGEDGTKKRTALPPLALPHVSGLLLEPSIGLQLGAVVSSAGPSPQTCTTVLAPDYEFSGAPKIFTETPLSIGPSPQRTGRLGVSADDTPCSSVQLSGLLKLRQGDYVSLAARLRPTVGHYIRSYVEALHNPKELLNLDLERLLLLKLVDGLRVQAVGMHMTLVKLEQE